MITYEPELTAARDDGLIAPATAARLLAMQRREIFSLFGEIRALAWIGAMLVASGVSVLIANHIRDIGALTIAIVLGLAAAGCYAWAWLRRGRTSLVDDSILLLGAMILSADAGWIASQWHLAESARVLLFLAIIHAIGAYRFDSRALLSLSIGALAGWLGIDRNLEILFSSNLDLALHAFICAAILAVWREADRRAQKNTTFTPVLDHTAILLMLTGALIMTTNRDTTTAGLLLTLLLGAGSAFYAFRARTEAFLLYAVIFSTLAVDVWVWHTFSEPAISSLFTLLSTIAAVVGLIHLHHRFRGRT